MTAPYYAVEALEPPALLLRGQGVLDALYLVRKGIEAVNPNSSHMPRFQALFREIVRAYNMSSQRHDHVVSVGAQGQWETSHNGATERISTDEAAHILGLHRRSVQRLAPSLGGLQRAGRWSLDRSAVVALKALRDEDTDDRAAAAA